MERKLYLTNKILKDCKMEVDYTIDVKLTKMFRLRLWSAIQLIKLASAISGMGIEVKK